ncbi:PAP2 superfamily-domain-containing protein [Aspergillus bertholletiae]|uniref:PAP2 superfamily-domain-containing protein n=1 Tax=Aspergillus bertholletiae TaxID=1226010 RepID=A0A5N7APK1_9EURO|nr:PAP2 superfamily-domain-containing protein [Aspergillus bertholletiae]
MRHSEKSTYMMRPRQVDIAPSKRWDLPVLLSYVIDWVFIVGIALIGYGFHTVTPNHRPFTLTDPSISFPYTEHETVPMTVAIVVALIVPAVIIVFVALVLVSGSRVPQDRATVWRMKLWEWNAGWLGLGLAAAAAFMATEGLKNLYGRPRPDLLARCDPDLENIAAYVVGGLGGRVTGAPSVVSWEICKNTDKKMLQDGFVSFPSGHSSCGFPLSLFYCFTPLSVWVGLVLGDERAVLIGIYLVSFAGLTYLSLWLCAKFSIGFPYLAHSPFGQDLRRQRREAIRNLGAAPPVLLVILAFVPMAVAFFIAASRFFNFRHHAFDIIFGSVMGMVFAWGAFRLYHLPIMRGGGWAWGARSRRHAFFKGIGLPSHIGGDDWSSMKDISQAEASAAGQDIDLESAPRNLAE